MSTTTPTTRPAQVSRFQIGEQVVYTDRQGDVTVGAVTEIEPHHAYGTGELLGYYIGIDGLGVLVFDDGAEIQAHQA